MGYAPLRHDPTVEHVTEHLAITRLQAAYGDAVTRQAWDELVPMFEPECRVRLDLHSGNSRELIGGRQLADFIAASVERFEFFVFTLLNSVVEVDAGGDEATGRLYIQELRQERDGHRWTTAVGLYRDRYRRRADTWRFAGRDYTSLARTRTDGDGMDVFPIP